VGPNIYLFEDDESLRALVAELLRDELDAQISECHNLAELHELCASKPPDLIVADFWGTSHLRLADAERSEISMLAAIAPLVLVSARNWAFDTPATELGVVALMAKPLDLDGFVEILRTTLANVGSSSEQAGNLPPHDAMSVFVLGWP
jgi:DNA-binding NtrC family response regulator